MSDCAIPAPVESVLITDQLRSRPSRSPDYQTENRALVSLARNQLEFPENILQTLADTILDAINAGSAGVSLLRDGGTEFYWPAIAGAWKPHIGGGTPRGFGPCGDVLDRNTTLLFSHPERRYTYLQGVVPPLEEVLLVPFYVEHKAIGTIWSASHNVERRFDAEDERLMTSLGTLASSTFQELASLDADRLSKGYLEQEVWVRGAPRHLADQSLLESIKSGNERALEALYHKYASLVYSVALRILKDTAAAEEILQDTFLYVWSSAAKFNAERGTIVSWLMVITRSRAVSQLRARVSTQLYNDYDLDLVLDSGSADLRAHREMVLSALDQLTALKREAVTLAYFEGLTAAEISVRTGTPVGTVKTRLRTALRSMKRVLSGYD